VRFYCPVVRLLPIFFAFAGYSYNDFQQHSYEVECAFYEAVLDASVWPDALLRLADSLGMAQVALGAFDHRIGAARRPAHGGAL
jgi:hypothetical protein